MSYASVFEHAEMIRDSLRTDAFRQGILLAHVEDRIVADLGCGTGILSFFAETAGARAVFAIEETSIVRVARRVAELNGFKRIEFFSRNSSDVVLSEAVDVLVSEWMGHFAFWESMYLSVLAFRDRWLKSGGLMIPSEIHLRCAMVNAPDLHKKLSALDSKPYGLDFGVFGGWPLRKVHLRQFGQSELVSSIATLDRLNMLTATGVPRLFARTSIARDDTVHGVCGWFDANIIGDIWIRTGPLDPKTHWAQCFFPLPCAMAVKEGDQLEIEITPILNAAGASTRWIWSVRRGSEIYLMNDFMHESWLQRKDASAGSEASLQG